MIHSLNWKENSLYCYFTLSKCSHLSEQIDNCVRIQKSGMISHQHDFTGSPNKIIRQPTDIPWTFNGFAKHLMHILWIHYGTMNVHTYKCHLKVECAFIVEMLSLSYHFILRLLLTYTRTMLCIHMFSWTLSTVFMIYLHFY